MRGRLSPPGRRCNWREGHLEPPGNVRVAVDHVPHGIDEADDELGDGVGGGRLAAEDEGPGTMSRPGFALIRLKRVMMWRMFSSCRLYSWIRFTWQSKRDSTSTWMQSCLRMYAARDSLPSRFTCRQRSLNALSSARGRSFSSSIQRRLSTLRRLWSLMSVDREDWPF